MSTILRLSRALWDQIGGELRSAWPAEACGLLIGRRAQDGIIVTTIVPSPNVAAPERLADRFEIEPALLLRVHRECRGTDTEIIGHYHSHPNGKAELSAIDRAHAYSPDLVWLVVAVTNETGLTPAAFLQSGTAPDALFERLSIEIV